MPEHLTPGVYIEETSFRAKGIEGVGAHTAGFVGPTRWGPVEFQPGVLTSLADFERLYGDGRPLDVGGEVMTPYLWHAVRAFFEEGGKRLYLSRVFKPIKGAYPPSTFKSTQTAHRTGGRYDDGHARASVPAAGGKNGIQLRARFPGAAGNRTARLTLRLGENLLGGSAGAPTVAGLVDYDLVRIGRAAGDPPSIGALYIAKSYYDKGAKKRTWRFTGATIDPAPLDLSDLLPDRNRQRTDTIRVVTLTVSVDSPEGGAPQVWEALPLDPRRRNANLFNSFSKTFGPTPPDLSQAKAPPIVVQLGTGVKNGIDLAQAMSGSKRGLLAALDNLQSTDDDRSVVVELVGGNDGQRPSAGEFDGGLKALEAVEEILIVAAPGATYRYEKEYREEGAAILAALISHAERMRYRFALLDSGDGQTLSETRALRARFDSKHAAFYYPWITLLDPITQRQIQTPPSGFVAGIYTRSDLARGIYKAPSDEPVNLAVGLETILTKDEQDLLNPEGINCFRFFPGRGFRLWGARTISSDPEWKYVNLRRYFAYLEQSIDRGTQWAVFEPNGEALWADVRRTIEDFLLNEWRSGALLGDKPEKAYFVRCDRSTMTQNDLDNGRLIVQIGFAPLRPAEFVIFRIGQWTADRKP
jgi:phage tail sheath protein FI